MTRYKPSGKCECGGKLIPFIKDGSTFIVWCDGCRLLFVAERNADGTYAFRELKPSRNIKFIAALDGGET